jgi:putative glycosyl hydrolase-like family 15 (GHL15) protein
MIRGRTLMKCPVHLFAHSTVIFALVTSGAGATFAEEDAEGRVSRALTGEGSGMSAAYPEFSWDRIPRYMHIRKAHAFTEQEIAFLAEFPLITFEKATGYADHGSVEAGTLAAARAVKRENPKATILYYRNVIVHYGNQYGYCEANKGLDHIPGALLADTSGNRNLIRGRVPAYDLSDPAMRDWWLESFRHVVADSAIDGLFLDGNIKVLDPNFLRRDIGDAKKQQAMDGYDILMKQTRETMGPRKLMVANILRARFPQAGLEHLDYFDGSYLEEFFHEVGGVRYEDYVAKGIDAMQTAARGGKIIAFSPGLKSAQNNSAMGIDQTVGSVASDEEAAARLSYPLAIFLIAAEKYSYFRVHEGYSANDNTSWMRWFPEYDKTLGPPSGPAVREGLVYTRKFKHADVYLDIGKRLGRVTWR